MLEEYYVFNTFDYRSISSFIINYKIIDVQASSWGNDFG